MQNKELILSLQRRLATLCSLEQTLMEQNAVLAQAYRDLLQARRTKPLQTATSTDRTDVRSGRADACKGSEGLLRRLKSHHCRQDHQAPSRAFVAADHPLKSPRGQLALAAASRMAVSGLQKRTYNFLAPNGLCGRGKQVNPSATEGAPLGDARDAAESRLRSSPVVLSAPVHSLIRNLGR
jgi:hypothetical protein